MKDANINVRLEDSIYRNAKELGVDFSEVVRMAIVNEIERKRMARINEAMEGAGRAVKKMGKGSIAREIRHARETR